MEGSKLISYWLVFAKQSIQGPYFLPNISGATEAAGFVAQTKRYFTNTKYFLQSLFNHMCYSIVCNTYNGIQMTLICPHWGKFNSDGSKVTDSHKDKNIKR